MFEKELRACRAAAKELRAMPTQKKNAVLLSLARLMDEKRAELLEGNRRDLDALDSRKDPPSAAFRDRLSIGGDRIDAMVESLKQVAALADPVGEEVDSRILDNGLLARRVRSPLGVILMIFESRPNVAVEAFSLAFKSGNVIILRGGKESMQTTGVIYDLIGEALSEHGLSPASVWGIRDPDRGITEALLKQPRWIDIVVPRGGDRLIEFVMKESMIPIIKNDRGMCHVYVHEDADQEMALAVVENAKLQRPGVCNAMETLLVHSSIAQEFLPRLHERLKAGGVRWFGDARACGILPGKPEVQPASPSNWDQEYLDAKMNCRVVDSLEEAIEHIEAHGSRHSESIVTASEKVARHFQSEVDAAAVYWNASTRFTDGFALGLGGELGISTQKLHVRGPVGLRELTSVRWVIDGKGQVRS